MFKNSDGQADGRTDDITISVEPIFQKCALKITTDLLTHFIKKGLFHKALFWPFFLYRRIKTKLALFTYNTKKILQTSLAISIFY
jgi:hypothetical protein